jgi:hypothetical protein
MESKCEDVWVPKINKSYYMFKNGFKLDEDDSSDDDLPNGMPCTLTIKKKKKEVNGGGGKKICPKTKDGGGGVLSLLVNLK